MILVLLKELAAHISSLPNASSDIIYSNTTYLMFRSFIPLILPVLLETWFQSGRTYFHLEITDLTQRMQGANQTNVIGSLHDRANNGNSQKWYATA